MALSRSMDAAIALQPMKCSPLLLVKDGICMANCPGCGGPALLNVVEDDKGQIWHSDCLQRLEIQGPQRKRAQRQNQQGRLQRELDTLRTMRETLKSD